MATRYVQIKMVVPYFVKEHQHSAASSAGSLKAFLLCGMKNVSSCEWNDLSQVTKANRMNHLQQNTISGDLQPLGGGRGVHLRATSRKHFPDAAPWIILSTDCTWFLVLLMQAKLLGYSRFLFPSWHVHITLERLINTPLKAKYFQET